MIKIRVDVDYPYPSRTKSFAYVALQIKSKRDKDYLKNSHIIARMINESPKDVKCYWFFTPYTIPDKALLDLLASDRHEVGLHVANKSFEEWKTLEKETNRTVKYYTIHGTERRLAKIIWRRHGKSRAEISKDFPLESLHNLKTYSLDALRFDLGYEGSVKSAHDCIEQGIVLSIHPEWLFTRGPKRGPYYDVLKAILDVDKEMEPIRYHKRATVKLANDFQEYEKNAAPSQRLLEKLADRNVDLYSFPDRGWCCPIKDSQSSWVKEPDNISLLTLNSYEEWWQSIGKKTRNMVRKAEKSGVIIQTVQPDDKLAEGIYKIYNETPIRQGRAFTHFGASLETIKGGMYESTSNTFIGAYLDGKLLGFIQLLHGDHVSIVSNILSLQAHWDKALNNALLAKAVEVCSVKGERYLMYGRIGNHPSLDKFKENSGFVKFAINRYWVPITSKGRLAIRLGLQKSAKDTLPDAIKGPLIPTLNWVSRTKVKVKMRIRKR